MAKSKTPAPKTAEEETQEKQAQAVIALSETKMVGSLRDCVLDLFKHRQKPWQQMAEQEQREAADRIEFVCREAVAEAVAMIAKRGFDTIPAQLKTFQVDGKMKLVLEAVPLDEVLVAANKARGKTVQIIVADPRDFGGADPAKVDKDEPELPIDGALDELAEAGIKVAALDDAGNEWGWLDTTTEDEGGPFLTKTAAIEAAKQHLADRANQEEPAL
jgi:hypothetical protein